MKLLSFPTSPFARKVRIAAIEVGVADQVEVIDANPFATDGVVSGANPLGKIPALVLADRTLVDSPLIWGIGTPTLAPPTKRKSPSSGPTTSMAPTSHRVSYSA